MWLIRKDQLEGLPTGTPVRPTCFTMSPPTGHYYARWDDTDGVSVVWEGMDLMDLGLYMRPDDLDVNGNPVDPGVAGLYNMAMAPETITEVVFQYPGLGRMIIRAIDRADYRVLRAGVLTVAIIYMLATLGADLLIAWMNPRARLQMGDE